MRILIPLAVLACSLTHAATIRKTDDTSVTGDITSIADGKLTVAAKSAPVVISFEQIAQIIFKEPPAPPAPAPPPQPVADNNTEGDDSPGLLAMLFGASKSHPHTETPAAATAAAPTTTPVATTQPAAGVPDAPTVQVTLTDGDVLHAKLSSWSDQKIDLKLVTGTSLQLPATAVTEVWFGTADMQKKARGMPLEAGPEDVAFVAKENDVVIVKGLAQGITGGSLQFRFGDEDRKIGLGKIVGLLLRGNSPAPLAGFHQRIRTDNGDQFSGSLTGIDKDYLTLTSPAGTMKIALPSVTIVDFTNGRVTSLCDLKPAKVEQTPYFGRVIPYRIDHSLTGGPLILSDGPCRRGIAVHSRCVLTYELAGDVDRFKTRLGFQQPEGLHGRVEARVIGDGKVLYENPDARGEQPPIDIDVALTGVRMLTLEIDFGKDQDVGDRVVWGNPRLIRGK